jgi:hypothetical protein
MRLRFSLLVLALVLVGGLVTGARFLRTPALPAQHRPLADMGAVKSDLFIYARAELAFYASSGRYADMQELRSRGLLSLPPDVRWPYFYSIHTPSPDRFVIVAIAQGPFGARPIALSIDDDFNMREFDSHRWGPPEHRRRHGATRQRFS